MKSPRRSAAILALLVLGVAGCTSPDRSQPRKTPTAGVGAISIPPVEPADGKTLKGPGFSYEVPKGWVEANEFVPEAVSVAVDGDDADGFTDNINVIRLDPAPIRDLDELEDTSVDELEEADGTKVQILNREELDGSTGIHISAGLESRGKKYTIEQFNVIHDDVAYVVTFSFSLNKKQATREKITQTVLITWNWKD